MEKLCDLHVHSTFSDGTCTPEELIDIAQSFGMGAVALCDHNTVAGLPSFLMAAQGREVEAVPGVEFTTEFEGTELHILGLFIQPEHYDLITEVFNDFRIRKEQSNIALVAALKRAGILLDYDAMKNKTPDGYINRAVIGAEMVRLGYCESVKAAFSGWLSPKHGYYIPPKRLDAFDAIRFIKSIGAVAVFAHPFLNLDEEGVRRFLNTAKQAGLDGMEVYYPLFDEDQTRLACRIAEEYGLCFSGGSDFHGANKPHIQMGTGMDNLAVPMSVLNTLKQQSVFLKNN